MSIAYYFKDNLMKMLSQSNDTDKFEDNKPKNDVSLIVTVILLIFNTIIFVYAIYLSFKRNKGFDLLSFLAACCCSLCYIVYAWAVPIK